MSSLPSSASSPDHAELLAAARRVLDSIIAHGSGTADHNAAAWTILKHRLSSCERSLDHMTERAEKAEAQLELLRASSSSLLPPPPAAAATTATIAAIASPATVVASPPPSSSITSSPGGISGSDTKDVNMLTLNVRARDGTMMMLKTARTSPVRWCHIITHKSYFNVVAAMYIIIIVNVCDSSRVSWQHMQAARVSPRH